MFNVVTAMLLWYNNLLVSLRCCCFFFILFLDTKLIRRATFTYGQMKYTAFCCVNMNTYNAKWGVHKISECL